MHLSPLSVSYQAHQGSLDAVMLLFSCDVTLKEWKALCRLGYCGCTEYPFLNDPRRMCCWGCHILLLQNARQCILINHNSLLFIELNTPLSLLQSCHWKLCLKFSITSNVSYFFFSSSCYFNRGCWGYTTYSSTHSHSFSTCFHRNNLFLFMSNNLWLEN